MLIWIRLGCQDDRGKHGKGGEEKKKLDKKEEDGKVRLRRSEEGQGIFFFLWKFTCQAGRLPAAYSRKIYLTSASQGDKRVDWQRAESRFWSCVLTSDSSSCLFSLNRSTLPIQTKVTDQSTAPLGCCTTPQAKREHTHTHTHEGPHWHIQYMQAHTQNCIDQIDYLHHVDRINNRLLKEVVLDWCLASVCVSCQEGPGPDAVRYDAALTVRGRQRRAMCEECLKICNQGNWISSPHCICIESEAHAQIIITKIPIN